MPAAGNPQSADPRTRGYAGNPQSPTLPAVARIAVPERDGISYGSGTLIDARGQFGLVISNWHVVRDAAGPITVEFPDGFKSQAEVVKTDKDWDLAALSVYRPRVAPLPITATPPQPGEPLTIAGYGSGNWKMSSGRCTQYLAPGVEFPHEMVELSAEARQGDSGGPILNQRGELAGVLFGSGPGYTSGSYGGRVLQFLATVVPGGAPGNDGLQSNSLPPDRALAAADPLQTRNGFESRSASEGLGSVPQATALHENRSAAVSNDALTPVQRVANDPLLTPPPRTEVASRFGPSAAKAEPSDIDPRIAVSPGRHDFGTAPLDSSTGSSSTAPTFGFSSSKAARAEAAPAEDGGHAPDARLLAVIWQRFGGPTLFDQTKAILALMGGLWLIIVFLRIGRSREPEHYDE